MDTGHPPDAWKRLGKALQLRRWQLGYGHGQRGRFARERGSQLSTRTLARIERGERSNYPAATLTHVNSLYGLTAGSVEAFLNGGEFTLADDPTVIVGLTEDEARTVRAFVEILRRNRDAAKAAETEERPA